MDFLTIFCAGMLPAVVLWLYIRWKDPQPEPLSAQLRAVALGILICVPVAVVEEMMTYLFLDESAGERSLVDVVTDAFLVTAVTEEFFKLLALWLVLRKNRFFDEHFDGIVYAVCVGLGFAGVENVMYLLDGGDDWQTVALMRALMSVPGHYAFAVLMGYYYSVHHFVDRSWRTGFLTLGVPVLAHGLYDAFLMSAEISLLLGCIGFIAAVCLCIRVHKVAYRKILAQLKRDQDAIQSSSVA